MCEFSHYQRTACAAYVDGAYQSITHPSQAYLTGDKLFEHLLDILADPEHQLTTDEAVHRLHLSIAGIRDVIHAIEAERRGAPRRPAKRSYDWSWPMYILGCALFWLGVVAVCYG